MGVTAYGNGQFEKAIQIFEGIAAEPNDASASLHYNLGCSYYRLPQIHDEGERIGMAVVNFRRALALDPGFEEAQQNLKVLESRFNSHLFQRSPIVSYLREIGAKSFGAVAWITGWCAILFFLVIKVLRPHGSTASLFTVGSFALLGICLATFVCYRLSRLWENDLATEYIVAKSAARAFSAPASSSSAIAVLPPGSQVMVLQQRGPWCYSEIPVDLRGWVLRDSLVKLIPDPITEPDPMPQALALDYP